jgi:uncharacterized protein
MALTTFRADGRPVSTPVWFVVDGGELVVWTNRHTRKARRLQRDPRCTVPACTFRGRVLSNELDPRAQLAGASEGERLQRLLRSKYLVQMRVLSLYTLMRRQRRPQSSPADIYLRVSVGR